MDMLLFSITMLGVSTVCILLAVIILLFAWKRLDKFSS